MSQFIEMFGDSSVVRLEDKIATQSGGTPNTKKLKYYEGGNIPWLSSSEVYHSRRFRQLICKVDS